MKKNIEFLSENVIAIINLIVILLNKYEISKHALRFNNLKFKGSILLEFHIPIPTFRQINL